MTVQAVLKSVDEGVVTAAVSQLYEVTGTGGERKIAVAPCSGDHKEGASIVIPAAVSIDISAIPIKPLTCVLTDDEGNVISDAYDLCHWISADTGVATVDQRGFITPGVAAGGPINVTVTCLGKTDTIAVTITDIP